MKNTAHALNTPPVGTPPRGTTPPPQAEKRRSDKKTNEQNGVRSGADAINPNALSKALMKEFEEAGRHRDLTPGGSPSRKRPRFNNADR